MTTGLVPRNEQGHILKGHTGNPGGRPKDLVGKIIRQYEEDHDFPIAKVLFAIALEGVHPFNPQIKPRTRDVISAAQILWDRGYGKAPQEIIHSEGDTHTGLFDNLPMPKLQALMKVLDGLDSPESLDELIRLANIPVVEGEVKDGVSSVPK